MTQETPPSSNNGNNNQPRRSNNNRRRHHNANRSQGNGPQAQNNNGQAAQQNQNKKRPQHNHQNRPRPQHQQNQNNQGGFNIERIYEKYLNLLDQHLIARRKYHDLFFRADPNQKYKLEKNFFNTLNDVRDFEDKLAPDVRDLFEKRNNGYQYDRIYTQNHSLPIEGDIVPNDIAPAEPHLLQSQISADFAGDTEESVGTADDYLKYKNLY